jgi:hypothetical protein
VLSSSAEGLRTRNGREFDERSRAVGERLRGREPTITGEGAASAHGSMNSRPNSARASTRYSRVHMDRDSAASTSTWW